MILIVNVQHVRGQSTDLTLILQAKTIKHGFGCWHTNMVLPLQYFVSIFKNKEAKNIY